MARTPTSRKQRGFLATFGMAAVLLGATLALPPAAAIHRDDLPALFSDTTAVDKAWGVRIDVPAGGEAYVDVLSFFPVTAARMTVGFAFTDEAGNGLGMASINYATSPDRFLIAGISADVPAGASVRTATSATDATCELYCIIADFPSAGTHRFAAWVAGAPATLVVRATPGTTVAVNPGLAYAKGDAEFTNGSPDVQVQQSVVAGYGPGAKLIKDASLPLTAEHRLYGIWYAVDFKFVCAFVCLGLGVGTALEAFCPSGAPACSTAALSWSGPSDAQAGALFYPIRGRPAGDYVFRIDRMADTYLSRGLQAGYAALYPGEFVSVLTLADVAVP